MARKAKVPAKIRAAVLARDNHVCRACGFGGSANHAGYLDCDHIIAESKGGATTLENLQALCKVCNGLKGKKFDRQFTVRVASQPEEIWAYNQGVIKSAFSVRDESVMATRLRKLK